MSRRVAPKADGGRVLLRGPDSGIPNGRPPQHVINLGSFGVLGNAGGLAA